MRSHLAHCPRAGPAPSTPPHHHHSSAGAPAMDAPLGAAPGPGAPPPEAAAGEQQAAPRVERLSAGVQQQLNLEGMRARAVGLYKAISRILEDFDVIARTNPTASPKW